jgi:PAS domain S-box-containing protein
VKQKTALRYATQIAKLELLILLPRYAASFCGLLRVKRMDVGEQYSGQREDQRFRLLVESVTDYAIYMLDSKGNVTSWNPGAQRFKGYRPHEIIGEHFSRFYTEEDRAVDLPRKALRTAEQEGSVANSVFTCLYWGARAGRWLENQRLSTVVVTGNCAEKCLYFEFATEPARLVQAVARQQAQVARRPSTSRASSAPELLRRSGASTSVRCNRM